MIIQDLKVGDYATYFYMIWGQQVIVRGEVIEILDDSIILSNDRAKYFHKIPKKNLMSRDKRPEEIEEEKRIALSKLKIRDKINRFSHISGVILLDRETKKEINTTQYEIIDDNEKEELVTETTKDVTNEPKQERWNSYNGKHRNQTNEGRSESRKDSTTLPI